VLLAEWLLAVEIDAFGLDRGYVAVKGEQIVAAASLHDYPLLEVEGRDGKRCCVHWPRPRAKGSWREPAEATWTGIRSGAGETISGVASPPFDKAVLHIS
jgi:hypothetical protein